MDVDFTLAATRSYLRWVYPGAHFSEPHRTFASIDLFYVRDGPSCLPYVPPGAFFEAPDHLVGSLMPGASPTRYTRMLRQVDATINGSQLACFQSGVTGRHGPQPAWTPHTVLTRYVLYPAGMCVGATRRSVPSDACASFDLRGSPPIDELFALRDGDRLEVTQYGGWLTPGRESGNGLWANVWRGSGIFVRLAAPFVTLCKLGGLVDLLLALHRADASAWIEVRAQLSFDSFRFLSSPFESFRFFSSPSESFRVLPSPSRFLSESIRCY